MKKLSLNKMIISLTAIMLLTLFSCNVAQAPGQAPELGNIEHIEEVDINEDGNSESRGLDTIHLDKILDLDDILKHPSDYFSCIADLKAGYLDVGLNKLQLNETLESMPDITIYKANLGQLILKKLEVESIDNGKIEIKGSVRVKVLDFIPIDATIKIEGRYYYDSLNEKLVLRDYKTTKIEAKNVLIKAIKKTVEFWGKQKLVLSGSLSESISIDFLPKELIAFNKFHTKDHFLYIRFTIPKVDINRVMRKIINKAEAKGFDCRKYKNIDFRRYNRKIELVPQFKFKSGDYVRVKTSNPFHSTYLATRSSGGVNSPYISKPVIASYPQSWRIKEYTDSQLRTTYTIGSLGIKSGGGVARPGWTELTVNDSTTKWTIKRLTRKKFTISSGNKYLALNGHSQYGSSLILSTNTYYWTIY